jgi:hypothetical protein
MHYIGLDFRARISNRNFAPLRMPVAETRGAGDGEYE